jgi:hypothetical protein
VGEQRFGHHLSCGATALTIWSHEIVSVDIGVLIIAVLIQVNPDPCTLVIVDCLAVVASDLT